RLRLDEQDVAADRRPRQPGRDAGLRRAPPRLGEDALLAEQLAHVVLADRDLAVAPVLGDAARDLAADRADLALEARHAGLPRVLLDDPPQRLVADRDPRLAQAVALDLAWHQVALGDLELFLLGVARDLNDLHAVAQRTRNRVERVRGRDEHHIAQVER